VFKVYARNKDGKEFNEAEEIRALDASNAYRINRTIPLGNTSFYSSHDKFITTLEDLRDRTFIVLEPKEAGYNLISGATVTTDDQLLGSIKNSRPVIRWAAFSSNLAIELFFDTN